MTSSPQYYNEIVCDPKEVDRVYIARHGTCTSPKTAARRSTPSPGESNRHVDDHALWIDPTTTDHLLMGCDGGIYETYDRGARTGRTWPNLPVTQFYRVSESTTPTPFYYVYGGTQDNNSTQGGPSRTTDPAGHHQRSDWFVTVGGDGYETVVDPEDPNIVYSQWQYGGLVRHDRQSGEVADIKPREPAGEKPYVWNWDSPLILSPHGSNRAAAAFRCLPAASLPNFRKWR